jgi:hypothetical protein
MQSSLVAVEQVVETQMQAVALLAVVALEWLCKVGFQLLLLASLVQEVLEFLLTMAALAVQLVIQL